MTVGAALVASLLVTLATPATWPLALADVPRPRRDRPAGPAPIVVLPTPVGLGTRSGHVDGDRARPAPMEALVGAAVSVGGPPALAGRWRLAGRGIRGRGCADRRVRRGRRRRWRSVPSGLRRAATGGRGRRSHPRRPARSRTSRCWSSWSWGSVRLVLVTYAELTSPLDVSTPIVLRVLRGTPEVVAAIVSSLDGRRDGRGRGGAPDRPRRRRGRPGAGRGGRVVPAPSAVGPRPVLAADGRPRASSRARERGGRRGLVGRRARSLDEPDDPLPSSSRWSPWCSCGWSASCSRASSVPGGRQSGPWRRCTGRGRSGGPRTADRVTGAREGSSATL